MTAQSILNKAEYWLTHDIEFARNYWSGLKGQTVLLVLNVIIAGPLLGVLLSYGFRPVYTSQALLAVESAVTQQGDPESSVPQNERISGLPRGLSQSRLESVAEADELNGRAETAQSVDQMRKNLRIRLAGKKVREANADGKKSEDPPVANYYVEYSSSTPMEAQQVCNEVTSMLLQENLSAWKPLTESLADTVRQLNDAQRSVDERAAKLSSFNQKYASQLDDSEDETEDTLSDLNAQLKRISENVKLAEQNQTRLQSSLAQEQAKNRKPQPTRVNTAALQTQLSRLQSQLLQLQAQYADDHPDVVKTKSEMAEIQKKLALANAGETPGAQRTNSNQQESQEMEQLRSQIEQYHAAISDGKSEQKRIQAQIASYERRQNETASAETRRRRLQRQYQEAQNAYGDLLAKKRDIENKMNVNAGQSTAKVRMLRPASLPIQPSFPNRRLFAATGLLVSLAGCFLALSLKVR